MAKTSTKKAVKDTETTVKEENLHEDKEGVIMGLDISTACIGICLLRYDESHPYGEILELTHVNPKVSGKIKGVESLFIKKRIFSDEFLTKWKDKGIKRVIIESPLLRSNNVNTVGVLLQFNGMVSDAVYNELGIVPEYISSYDARKYSFPDFMAIRKFGKDGESYSKEKLIHAVKNDKFVLFGGYVWDIDKKTIIQAKVAELFPDIPWLLDKSGELKKENFDACDAYVACLGKLNKDRYGELTPKATDIEIGEDKITFNLHYWDRTEPRTVIL
jgi:hypothetical protein